MDKNKMFDGRIDKERQGGIHMKTPSKAAVLTFAAGAAASLIGAKFAASKTARRMAVRGLAEGMRLKDEALKAVESIREEACDLYEEARRTPDAEA